MASDFLTIVTNQLQAMTLVRTNNMPSVEVNRQQLTSLVVVNCVIELHKNVTPSAALLSLTCRTNQDHCSIIFFIGMGPYNIKQ
jgi:hypothetical protein